MTLMLGKLYAALKAVNVPETEAREAAEEGASVVTRVDNIDRGLEGMSARIDRGLEGMSVRIDRGLEGVNARIDLLRTEVTGEIAALRTEFKGEIGALRAEFKGEIRRLEWMVAGLLAVALAVAARLFLHG